MSEGKSVHVLCPMDELELRKFAVIELPKDVGDRDVRVYFDMESASTLNDAAFAIGLIVVEIETGKLIGAYRCVILNSYLERFVNGVFDMKDRTEAWWSTQGDSVKALVGLVNSGAEYCDLYRLWVTVMNLVKSDTCVYTDAAMFDSVVLTSIAWNCGSKFMLGTDKIIKGLSVYSSVDEVPSVDEVLYVEDPDSTKAQELKAFMAEKTSGPHDPLYDAVRTAVWHSLQKK